jgi:hypothetical protein
MAFDYAAVAELFIPKKLGRGARQPLSYRRFATAAEAIRFAVEDFRRYAHPWCMDAGRR